MMRSIRTIFLLGLLTLSGSIASAQTKTLHWDQPSTTVAEAQALAYTVKIDTAAPVTVAQSCALVNGLTHCTTPLPALTSGTHTLIVTATNAFGSTPSSPLSGSPPSAPINITVVVTVQVP